MCLESVAEPRVEPHFLLLWGVLPDLGLVLSMRTRLIRESLEGSFWVQGQSWKKRRDSETHRGDTRTECQMEDLAQIWPQIVHCCGGATHTHRALSPQWEGCSI